VIRRIAVVALCALVLPASAAQAWTWPVDGSVLRPFSFDRAHPYAAGQHRGVDLGAPSGSDVLAPAEGVVTFAGTVPTGGKTVSIETPFGYTATLVHLGSIRVGRGTRVTEGAVVGTVGPSGVVDLTEPFVYFGLRVTGEDQGYVDPLTFLPVRPVVEAAAGQPERAVEAVMTPAPEVTPASAPAAVEPEAPAVETPAAPAVAASPRAGESVETPVPAASVAAPAASAASAPSADAARIRRPERGSGEVAGGEMHAASAAAPAERARSNRPTAERPTTVRPAPHAAPHVTRRGQSHRPLAWTGGLALALLVTFLCLWRRRKRVDARPIMARGEQLLHHDTDLLRQLDAPHRPRVHDDRGRHPRAPSQAARRADVLSHRDGRARLQGLPGGRGAGPRPEDVRRPDRRVLERAA
jgi:murein DD-endopeptidase MepM/ murein hydrolase activator NlpD